MCPKRGIIAGYELIEFAQQPIAQCTRRLGP